MRVWRSWGLALLIRPPTVAFATKCVAPPIALPYRATTIVPGRLVHGISVTVGNPPQPVALTPSLMLDHTVIPRYTNSCVHVSDMPLPSPSPSPGPTNATAPSLRALRKRDGHPGDFEEETGSSGDGKGRYWKGEDWWVKCAETYGGGYEPGLSTSYSVNTTYQADEILFDEQNYEDWKFVDETITFAGYLEAYVEGIEKVPESKDVHTIFVLPDNGTLFGGLGNSPLGLTPDSKLLAAMYSDSMIPSTSWTLSNDTLCLGCMDTTMHKGDFQVFKTADRKADEKHPCLIQATVEALNWRPKADAEGVTLIKESFKACIDPGVNFLVLPDDVRGAFEDATDRKVVAEYDDYVVLSGSTKEDDCILEFKLEGGLDVNVTIPGSGQADMEEKGEWRVPIGKGGWGSYGAGIWVLGKPFTEQVVLKWDSVSKEYGIAAVNEDPSREIDIHPLGCDKFPGPDDNKSTAIGTGVIAGSVVGGFFGGLLFAIAGLLFYRRGAHGMKSKYQPMLDEDVIPMGSIAPDRRTLNSISGANSTPSIRESMHSQGPRSVSPMMEPQLVPDNSIYEAPEGGTAYPTKRDRLELGDPTAYHR